jgi:hypothetical protein
MEYINTLCGQNAGLLCVKAGGTYTIHWALKGLRDRWIRLILFVISRFAEGLWDIGEGGFILEIGQEKEPRLDLSKEQRKCVVGVKLGVKWADNYTIEEFDSNVCLRQGSVLSPASFNIVWRACCRQCGMCWQPLLGKHHMICFLCGLTPACYSTMGRLRFLRGLFRGNNWGSCVFFVVCSQAI